MDLVWKVKIFIRELELMKTRVNKTRIYKQKYVSQNKFYYTLKRLCILECITILAAGNGFSNKIISICTHRKSKALSSVILPILFLHSRMFKIRKFSPINLIFPYSYRNTLAIHFRYMSQIWQFSSPSDYPSFKSVIHMHMILHRSG